MKCQNIRMAFKNIGQQLCPAAARGQNKTNIAAVMNPLIDIIITIFCLMTDRASLFQLIKILLVNIN